MHTLDLILIGHNEARHLPQSLAAAHEATARLAAARGLPASIWYVDSGSDDGSPELAATLGAKVLYAHPDYRSAANGRASGLALTTGDWVMVLDGDCTLHPEWLVVGCDYLAAHPDVAGVGGLSDSIRSVGGREVRVRDRRVPPPGGSEVHNHVGFGGHGFLYRRAALEAAGGYEPALIAQEEALVYCRLRRMGWGVRKIPQPMMTHWDDDLKSARRGWAKLRDLVQKNAFYQGIALRRALLAERLGPGILGFYRLQLAHAAWLLSLCGLALGWALAGWGWSALALAAGLTALHLAFLYHQKQNPLLVLTSLPLLTLYVAGITLSLLTNRPRVAWGAALRPEYRARLLAVNPGQSGETHGSSPSARRAR